MEVVKDRLVLMDDTMLCARRVKDLHQPIVMIAPNLVPHTVFFLIFLLQSWKMLIELPVEVFPVAVPQRKSYAKTDDAEDMRIDAVIE